MVVGTLFTHFPVKIGWYERIDQEGNPIWDAAAGSIRAEDNAYLQSVTETSEGAFVSVGNFGSNGDGGYIHSVDRNGNFLWERRMPRHGNLPTAIWLTNVLTLNDDKFLIGGWGTAPDTMGGRDDAASLLVKYELERDAPKIIYAYPPPPEVDSLRNHTIYFEVRAVDLQNDPINYLWKLDGETVGSDSLYDVLFEELGEHQLKCIVSGDEPADSVAWRIAVKELLIIDQTPDSSQLVLRRGTTGKFKVLAATAADQPPGYSWELLDVDENSSEVISEVDSAEVEFLHIGAYRLTGRAFIVGAADSVVWSIEVRSTIREFRPSDLSLSLEAPTTVPFSVTPFNPESDSLIYNWFYDDEVISDSSGIEFTFADPGQFQLRSYLYDGSEVDSLTWAIEVREPGAVSPEPDLPGLWKLAVYPNPFNSTTRIRYSLPAVGEVKLSLVDIRGREIATPVSGRQDAGGHIFTLDGTGIPAGIYFAKLEAGGNRQMVKVVLVR